jgi:putative ABC transport system permease protein
MLIVVFILFFIAYLLSSDFGLGLRAIGQNKKFASANGINVNAMTIFGLIISNALIAMCGAIFTQYQGFCDVSQGTGCLVVGLASVITGEKFLPKIKFIRNLEIKSRNFIEIFFALFSCVIGSIAYRIFIAIAINSDIFGLKTQDLNLITGLLIIFIMSRKQKC